MSERCVFDHVAIGVRSWQDGFPVLIDQLGGRWSRGGVAGDFAPCQLDYADEMKVELLQPGEIPGFVERFLERNGPGAHHLTWHVPDLDAFIDGCGALGLEVLPDHLDLPGRREAFVHPRVSGFGTLLQAIESADLYGAPQPWPSDIPPPTVETRALMWVALGVPDLALARALFEGVLDGRTVAEGAGWSLITWEPGRRLLVLDADAHTAGLAGVHHLLFGPANGATPEVKTILDSVAVEAIEHNGVRSVILDGEEPSGVGPA